MANGNEIKFDAASGISVEEQKEILAKINGIAEKNRRLLSQAPAGKSAVQAKKSGALFPLVINLAALVILIGGGLFLFLFNGKADAQIREGRAVYDLTERALINEIRKETADKLASKDGEIARILSHLDDVDAQLNNLQSSNKDLNTEQLAAQQRLITMQNLYRSELSALQEDRSKILEESRSREAVLRAQLEERAREFASAQQKSGAELDSAVSELEKLSNEQAKIAAIDSQLSGGLAAVSEMVRKGEYDEAAQHIESLKHFCNNNTYASLRSFQVKKEYYNQVIDSMEWMIDDMRKYRSGDQWSLQEKTEKLEDTIAEMQKTLDAVSSGSSGQAGRIAELTASVSTLETTVLEKEKSIKQLETEKTSLQTESQDRQTRLDSINEIIDGKSVTDMTLGELMENLEKIVTALEK